MEITKKGNVLILDADRRVVISSVVGYNPMGRDKVRIDIMNAQPAFVKVADYPAQQKALGELDEVFNGIPAGYVKLTGVDLGQTDPKKAEDE